MRSEYNHAHGRCLFLKLPSEEYGLLFWAQHAVVFYWLLLFSCSAVGVSCNNMVENQLRAVLLGGIMQFASIGNLHWNGFGNSVNSHRKKKKKKVEVTKENISSIRCPVSAWIGLLQFVRCVSMVSCLSEIQLGLAQLLFQVPGRIFVPLWCCLDLWCAVKCKHSPAQPWKSPPIPACSFQC